MRGGRFDVGMTFESGQCRQYTMDSSELISRIKSELNNADLKLTAPLDVIMKIINEAGSIDVSNLPIKYPKDWTEFVMNYETVSTSGSNEVYKIYEKARERFPRMMRGRGGGNNGRRSRRSRRKAKRVKRTKSMKRHNKRRQ